MRKYLALSIISCVSLFLISWGVVGHKTVATIAYNHLTPQAKAAVKALLGDTTMADAASWADQVLREPTYKHTSSWHYLNVPLGLSYKAFADSVTLPKNENVYSAIQKAIHVLNHQNNSIEKQREALKFLIHFVGDLHQPMHVSRKEDKGGNAIQVQYAGKGTNLHSLWDSKLIATEGDDFTRMAVDYDKASSKQIQQWQADKPMNWLWESYQISTKLYAEVAQNNKLDHSYYESHINIVHERIEMAGIRLAGILNDVFKGNNFEDVLGTLDGAVNIDKQSKILATNATKRIIRSVEIKNIDKCVGQTVLVCAKVYGYKVFENTTLLNLGAEYPNQLLTVVLKGEAKNTYKGLNSMTACVTGKVIEYKGKVEIVVTNPDNIGLAGTLH
ncbi:hypothetical protein ABIB62_003787 [Mucilaginibacter sp. UYP25]|uniref:S1/P1 nuclease n=1 Tax=unclassified Mucilaginibacter TaxID=2617802 RepID=UPI0033951BAB